VIGVPGREVGRGVKGIVGLKPGMAATRES